MVTVKRRRNAIKYYCSLEEKNKVISLEVTSYRIMKGNMQHARSFNNKSVYFIKYTLKKKINQNIMCEVRFDYFDYFVVYVFS